MSKISVLGGGSWGLTLANHLVSLGHDVVVWTRTAEKAEKLARERECPRRLPGIRLSDEISFTSDIPTAMENAEYLLFVVPSQAIRSVAKLVREAGHYPRKVISATKGIEIETGLRMSQVIIDELGDVAVAALSGPSIAIEVARKLPASVVAASENGDFAREVQELFHSSLFRVYTSEDIIGVELGGALKNIVAIAAGISDGMGFGANTKGALLTRGLAEIMRLGIHLGAKPVTFAGLSGMGDLITTSFSRHSRNRHVGEELGKGRKLDDILSEMVMVAEGVPTTEAVYKLSVKLSIDMPLTHAVLMILKGEWTPMHAVRELTRREPKPEYYLRWTGL